MKREKIIYLALIMLIAYLAIIDKNIFNNGETLTKIYDLDRLKLTQIDLNCEVYLTEGENEKLVIEAPEKILNKIEAKENNGILTISVQKRKEFFGLMKSKSISSGEVKIYVNHTQLDRIIVSDQAKIISVDYKPLSNQASVEEGNENLVAFAKLPSFRLSNMGLIDVITFIVNRL